MKTLLVTGQMAKGLVERYAKESGVDFEVLALALPVAALMNTGYIARELKSMSVSGYDMILVPGLSLGDASVIEKEVGIPTFKGPKYAADLPFVLRYVEELQLSKSLPACEVLKGRLAKLSEEELRKLDADKKLVKKKGNMLVRSLPVGKDFPMRVMAEIHDVPRRGDDEIRKMAEYFLHNGAEIIDLGMVAGESHPDDAERAVRIIRKLTDAPISIDTLDPTEAEAAIKAGADMLLSIDASNCEEISKFATHAVVVVIPTDHKRAIFPKKAKDRVELMMRNLKKARELGFQRLVGDLILDPIHSPSLVESIASYYEFRARDEDLPLLMGVANVAELLDADSVGVNALVAGIASELKVSILLTTEVSDKVRGSTSELSTAAKMMYLARRRGSVPKDLGLDLLRLKEKRLVDEPYDRSIEDERVIRAEQGPKFDLDPKGCFKILIDRENEELAALHYELGEREPRHIIKGKRADEVVNSIIKLGLVSRFGHVAYLSSELQKAELALRTGRSYVQDKPLFE